jgi:hypothetical protein
LPAAWRPPRIRLPEETAGGHDIVPAGTFVEKSANKSFLLPGETLYVRSALI